ARPLVRGPHGPFDRAARGAKHAMKVSAAQSIMVELERVAREAGELVRAGYRRGVGVHKKGAIDLVTEYDLASEALITRELGRVFPGVTVVGEEGQGKRAVLQTSDDRQRFFVDPIDGTTNFAHGHPFFAVSI